MAEWVSGKITHIEHWTDALFSIQVNAPVDPFTAGQFAKLALDINGERVQRAYSYVNAPSDHNLEFYLVTVPEGKLSPRLDQLPVGGSDDHQASRRVFRTGRNSRLRYLVDAGNRYRHWPLFVDFTGRARFGAFQAFGTGTRRTLCP